MKSSITQGYFGPIIQLQPLLPWDDSKIRGSETLEQVTPHLTGKSALSGLLGAVDSNHPIGDSYRDVTAARTSTTANKTGESHARVTPSYCKKRPEKKQRNQPPSVILVSRKCE